MLTTVAVLLENSSLALYKTKQKNATDQKTNSYSDEKQQNHRKVKVLTSTPTTSPAGYMQPMAGKSFKSTVKRFKLGPNKETEHYNRSITIPSDST